MAQRIRLVYGIIFALSLPVLLLATNLRYIASNPKFYEAGFKKYQVAEWTGITPVELNRVAQELIDYFGSQRETPQIQVKIYGETEGLFSPEEVIHLEDIKGLLELNRRVWLAALAVSLGYIAFLVARWRGQVWLSLAWATLSGSLLTLSLGLVLAAALALDFDWLFLQFHLVSFSNSFWQLTCPQDRLACLFQPGFFYDSSKLLAGAVATEALILGALAGTYLWWRRYKGDKRKGILTSTSEERT
ncbi:MAG: DUF1461 domain-containing protein [Chloroflexi bacterium]|nr:DUF1461 domain-containing protein [Chloroflexota bacterium]